MAATDTRWWNRIFLLIGVAGDRVADPAIFFTVNFNWINLKFVPDIPEPNFMYFGCPDFPPRLIILINHLKIVVQPQA